MKKYCEFQKVVSILLISIFVTSTPGCYSAKTLTSNDLPYPNKSHYILHGAIVKYKLTNAEISGGFLTGTIENTVKTPSKNQTVHFFVSPSSSIEKNGDTIKVPIGNLKRIEVYEHSPVITGILIGLIGLTVAGMIYGVMNMSVDLGLGGYLDETNSLKTIFRIILTL